MVRQIRKVPSSRRRGAALVEMAMVFPVFLIILFGIIEFGRAMMIGQLITNAAREGARLAVVGDTANSEVIADIKTFLAASGNIAANDVTVTITITPYPGNPAVGNNSLAAASSRDLVTVQVEVPFEKVSLLPPSFLQDTKLNGTSSMRYE